MRVLMIVMNFLNQNSGAFSVVFSCIVAAGTIIYACLTWKIIIESRKTREIQTIPKLHIDVEPKGSILNKNFQEEINKTLEIEVSFLDINGLKHIEERRINLKEFRDILIEGRKFEKVFFI